MSAQPAASASRPARKRRRRQASYSASSSSSSSAESSSSDETSKGASTAHKVVANVVDGHSSSSSSTTASSSSASSSSSDGSESDSAIDSAATRTKQPVTESTRPPRAIPRHPTLSPSPTPTALPSFLLPTRKAADADGDEDRRTRFRRVYMEHLVQGFGSDLEKLRAADPGLGPGRLQLLIESLAAGVDVYNDPKDPKYGTKRGGVDEVGVILGD